MKKLIAMTLALILCFSLVVPVSASDDLYMIFDGETDDGCGVHTDRVFGPVGYNYELGHPMPTQGENSYCIGTTTSQAYLFHNTNWNYPATTTGTFDATQYDYIELDLFASSAIVFNWNFGICSSEEDVIGSTWSLTSAYLPRKNWVHVKMPISAFSDFSEEFGGSMDNINRIKFLFTNIADAEILDDKGVYEQPDYTYLYIDNVVATKGDAGNNNQLITFEEFEQLPLDPWPEPQFPELEETIPSVGDANNDGCIDASDALETLQYAVGKITLADKTRADVDGNGEVTAVDALLVLQYSVGKITKFPVEVAHLPDTLMLYDCETREGATDNSMNTLESVKGPVLQNKHLGHPTPTQGDYSYCINTSGNQIMLNYTFPDSVDLSAYNYIEFDIYSNIEIVCNLNIDIATDTAATTGANWVLSDSWIPGERWYHVKIPISAFSDSTGIYGGSFEKVKQIKIELSKIVDGVELVDNGYPTTPDYTYIYFDNITATKNGAGKDNELIDVDTLMATPPEWYEEYRDDVTCGGI